MPREQLLLSQHHHAAQQAMRQHQQRLLGTPASPAVQGVSLLPQSQPLTPKPQQLQYSPLQASPHPAAIQEAQDAAAEVSIAMREAQWVSDVVKMLRWSDAYSASREQEEVLHGKREALMWDSLRNIGHGRRQHLDKVLQRRLRSLRFLAEQQAKLTKDVKLQQATLDDTRQEALQRLQPMPGGTGGLPRSARAERLEKAQAQLADVEQRCAHEARTRQGELQARQADVDACEAATNEVARIFEAQEKNLAAAQDLLSKSEEEAERLRHASETLRSRRIEVEVREAALRCLETAWEKVMSSIKPLNNGDKAAATALEGTVVERATAELMRSDIYMRGLKSLVVEVIERQHVQQAGEGAGIGGETAEEEQISSASTADVAADAVDSAEDDDEEESECALDIVGQSTSSAEQSPMVRLEQSSVFQAPAPTASALAQPVALVIDEEEQREAAAAAAVLSADLGGPERSADNVQQGTATTASPAMTPAAAARAWRLGEPMDLQVPEQASTAGKVLQEHMSAAAGNAADGAGRRVQAPIGWMAASRESSAPGSLAVPPAQAPSASTSGISSQAHATPIASPRRVRVVQAGTSGVVGEAGAHAGGRSLVATPATTTPALSQSTPTAAVRRIVYARDSSVTGRPSDDSTSGTQAAGPSTPSRQVQPQPLVASLQVPPGGRSASLSAVPLRQVAAQGTESVPPSTPAPGPRVLGTSQRASSIDAGATASPMRVPLSVSRQPIASPAQPSPSPPLLRPLQVAGTATNSSTPSIAARPMVNAGSMSVPPAALRASASASGSTSASAVGTTSSSTPTGVQMAKSTASATAAAAASSAAAAAVSALSSSSTIAGRPPQAWGQLSGSPRIISANSSAPSSTPSSAPATSRPLLQPTIASPAGHRSLLQGGSPIVSTGSASSPQLLRTGIVGGGGHGATFSQGLQR
eukprot:TRINITY_DN67313_c0_g1_i1.p1 TRINITY_DN67313_c0_g1~~TRINITY_DN67313_c0_g1_i1.p1  ORF type:complete len:932 (-),score=231.07 TRINITY_DN67313_c0_g1_i1:122-2917(-)